MYYFANPTNMTVWIVVGVIALLLFGGQKIPEMMRGLGSGMKEFKKGMSEDTNDDELRKEREREAEIRRRVEEEMRKGN